MVASEQGQVGKKGSCHIETALKTTEKRKTKKKMMLFPCYLSYFQK